MKPLIVDRSGERKRGESEGEQEGKDKLVELHRNRGERRAAKSRSIAEPPGTLYRHIPASEGTRNES